MLNRNEFVINKSKSTDATIGAGVAFVVGVFVDDCERVALCGREYFGVVRGNAA